MTSTEVSEETTTIQELPTKPWWMKIPSGTIVALVFLIGVAYVAYYLHLLGLTTACKDKEGLTFFQDCLSNLKMNEIGDSLGGAFAPLAFIFLAGALIIQSFELASQRHEINETQAVMASQLEVAREQVKETKASTALLAAQTKILKQQHSTRLADDEFNKMLFRARIELMDPDKEFGLRLQIMGDLGSNLSITGQHSTELQDFAFFDMISRKISSNIVSLEYASFERLSFVNEDMWEYFRELFAELADLTETCSPAYHSLAITYRTHDIHFALERLYELATTAVEGQTGTPDVPPPGTTPV